MSLHRVPLISLAPSANALLVYFAPVRSISDLQQIKLMSDIGVDDATRGNFVSAFGACMVIGGKLAGPSIRTFGPRGHTTLMNICTILSVSDESIPWAQTATLAQCNACYLQSGICTPIST